MIASRRVLQELRLRLELAVGRFLFPGVGAEIRREVDRELHRMRLDGSLEQLPDGRYRPTKGREVGEESRS
jgi:hypothetical protein